MWHWAHQSRKHCDPWWENETAWHRAWKGCFPEAWREVVHFDEQTGEKHVADVKTARGMVIEFQHSSMSPEELASREAFYGHMAWIVDAQPFSEQFTLYPDPLPQPHAELLDDIVLVPSPSLVYWRHSEVIPKSSLLRMHSAREISDEIQAEYRGHHFFEWKRRREVWFTAKAPVFLDFGNEHLLKLMRYSGPAKHWCVRKVSKRAFIDKNGGCP